VNSRHLPVTVLFLLLAAAGPTAAQDAMPFAPVVAQERAVLDAFIKNDTAAFNRALGSDFVYVDARGPVRWELAKTSAMIMDCKTTQLSIDNPQTTRVGNDLVVLTYSSSGDQTCGGQKAPSPVYSMSVWQMRGGRWVGVAHSEAPAAPKQ
jgi:Domain of unknown function (DUF4440)